MEENLDLFRIECKSKSRKFFLQAQKKQIFLPFKGKRNKATSTSTLYMCVCV
jgi:hypothetical protein